MTTGVCIGHHNGKYIILEGPNYSVIAENIPDEETARRIAAGMNNSLMEEERLRNRRTEAMLEAAIYILKSIKLNATYRNLNKDTRRKIEDFCKYHTGDEA